MNKILFLSLLISLLPLQAEVPREVKEKIGKDLAGDEEFKRAFIVYLETIDSLYEDNLYEDKEKFKLQYLNYIKSKNCMGFLASAESLDKITKYVSAIDSDQKKNPNYSKVQALMDEFYSLNTTFTKSPLFDGYKFCSFKVSEARIKSKVKNLGDGAIVQANLSVEEKGNTIFKDNVLMKKALKVFFADTKDFYTNSKLSNDQRAKLGAKFNDDTLCALYFTPEDQMETFFKLVNEGVGNLKSDPNYIKDADKVMPPRESKVDESLDGDYKKCSFDLDASELEKHTKRKASERKIVEERYVMIQKIITKSHPKIKEMMKLYESQFSMMFKDKEMQKRFFIKTLPDYLVQVDQSLAYSMMGMLKDEHCLKDVSAKVTQCAQDERFALVADKINLLMGMCVGEYQSELSLNCKFENK